MKKPTEVSRCMGKDVFHGLYLSCVTDYANSLWEGQCCAELCVRTVLPSPQYRLRLDLPMSGLEARFLGSETTPRNQPRTRPLLKLKIKWRPWLCRIIKWKETMILSSGQFLGHLTMHFDLPLC